MRLTRTSNMKEINAQGLDTIMALLLIRVIFYL